VGERTVYTPGTFCFADLGTNERERAAAFYGELFGWSAGPLDAGYTMFRLRDHPVAGMFEAPDGYTPSWLNYISVEDADAVAAAARERGATVLLEPREVSDQDVGRAAVIRDPQGAVFALWEPGWHRGAGVVNEVGAMVWNQLATSDVDAALDFYGPLFGWTTEPFEDGEGDYWNVRNRDGWENGGMMALPAEGVAPHWQVSFTVEDAGAAVARAEELGGGVILAPTQTAVGDIAVVHDPAGAAFGLFAGRTDP
jgi:predicted enzyme related to lactoylglutathione lyase